MAEPEKKEGTGMAGSLSAGFWSLSAPVLPGSCIGVVAPSGIPDPEALEAGLDVIRSRGYRLKVAEQVYMKDTHGFAGSDSIRARTLTEFFRDPSLDALWMARGGYGCTRLFPLLEPDLLKHFPKRIMGFSDGTALLAFLGERCHMTALHGPVITQLGRLTHEGRNAAFRALTWVGEVQSMGWQRVLCEGRAEGHLVGGNLSLLTRLLGTPWCPSFAGSILFLEDVNEAPYRIDRMMCHLSMAGALQAVKGVMLGAFMGCGCMQEVCDRILSHLPGGIPVVCGMPFGHGESNQPLALGAKGVLDTKKGYVEWSWPCESA
ncbi:LD-carboxypeptidase [Desulfobotulus sp. H1]|uniref:LD-carboxypeptidase n=1 Tax=Desulfobotulus pelophilus TaxID=2823377 RepID=A0ABT3NDT6_9BACT|nr:LD-carboxypeptidase [Desulfobotulus pelophilus]MCW7755087.1 LD-carboxypeptidase [Desulfobotulus pelophilus]